MYFGIRKIDKQLVMCMCTKELSVFGWHISFSTSVFLEDGRLGDTEGGWYLAISVPREMQL